MSNLSLADLRKLKGNSNDNLARLTKAAEEQSSKSTKEKDDRFWSLPIGKDGTAAATIRFLPNKNIQELPWVKYYSHSFQSQSGRWYIENSLTTFGEADPVSEMNKELWETGLESNKKLASARKRKLNYISNILVVSDKANPENEGKVFLYRYGKTIFDMINEKLHPAIDEDEAVEVFDLWEGADLKLRVHMEKSGEKSYPKYTKSSWTNSKPVAEDDEEILAIVNKSYDLSEFVDRSKFKSYDDLKKRLDFVLSTGKAQGNVSEGDADNTGSDEYESALMAAKADKPAPKKAEKKVSEDDEDDDIQSYFAKYADKD